MRNLRLQYLECCVLRQVKYALRTKLKCLNVILTLVDGKLVGWCIAEQNVKKFAGV